MSELENENQNAPEGVDPETGEVLEPEPEPAPTEPAPEPEPEPAEPAARDDRDIEAIYKRLDTRGANYIKSASEIVAGESVPLTLCEMCADAYPGLRWQQAQDELHARLIEVVTEIEQGAPLKDDPNVEVCHTCDGFGFTRLPSHVPGKQMRTCPACNGVGYRELNPQSGSLEAPAPAAPNGNSVPMPNVPLDDPRVLSLRAEGYTIMPPFTPQVETS